MAFNLATTAVQDTLRQVSAYLDEATGCSQALELQTQEPGVHERQTSLTLFHARSVPTIDLETYIARILKYCPCQSEVFLALIVYFQQMIDRCAARRVPFTVDAYSIHRLVITGVTIGSKWFSDVFFTNSRYAKVGGLSVSELNHLEIQFLSIVDFDLNIRPEVLQAIGADLFAGRLPKLTNTHTDPGLYLHMPAMAHRAQDGQQVPMSARYPQSYHDSADAHGPRQYCYQHPAAYQPTYQQPPPPLPPQRQRSHRHMSYPGPDGVYYKSYTAGGNHSEFHDVPGHFGQKMPHACEALDPSSGSTLASTPPHDTVPVSALYQDAA
ncbi:cyclin-like protein interacting with PHO85 [Coemansia sp. RSA 552]|nr:cyclin-like protein interacting with PHO85 [Coemansia sp. RSA 552]